jgi:hypothetical protein
MAGLLNQPYQEEYPIETFPVPQLPPSIMSRFFNEFNKGAAYLPDAALNAISGGGYLFPKDPIETGMKAIGAIKDYPQAQTIPERLTEGFGNVFGGMTTPLPYANAISKGIGEGIKTVSSYGKGMLKQINDLPYVKSLRESELGGVTIGKSNLSKGGLPISENRTVKIGNDEFYVNDAGEITGKVWTPEEIEKYRIENARIEASRKEAQESFNKEYDRKLAEIRELQEKGEWKPQSHWTENFNNYKVETDTERQQRLIESAKKEIQTIRNKLNKAYLNRLENESGFKDKFPEVSDWYGGYAKAIEKELEGKIADWVKKNPSENRESALEALINEVYKLKYFKNFIKGDK